MTVADADNIEELVTLLSNDKEVLPISLKALKKSAVIQRLFHDITATTDKKTVEVPVPAIDGAHLRKVIGYLEHHVDDVSDKLEWEERLRKDEIEPFDRSLVQVDTEELYKILAAANYLDVQQLVDLCCQTIANGLKGMKIEQIREKFNLINDFSKEEEDHIRCENGWYAEPDKESK